MGDLLKVGVIGVGGVTRVHMPGWAASEHAEVVAGADINGDVLANWAQTQFLHSNYETRQFYNSKLQLVKDVMEPHALECVDFARAVAEGDESPVPPEQSLQVLTILDGIYRSQLEGREVEVSTKQPA